MENEGLATKTVRSATWLYGQRILGNLIGLAAIAILARQLAPAEFGVAALAEVFLRFGIVYGSATVGNYVIYDRKEGREERTQAAFWLNMTLVLVTVLIVTLITPWLSRFYNQAILAPVLLLVLLRFALNQLSIIPEALIKRDFQYQKLVVRDSVLQIFSAAFSVGMAVAGYGVFSLVVPGILIAIPKFIIVIRMSGWIPALPLCVNRWGEVFSYTKNIIGSSLLGQVINDGDTLIIGKLLGSQALGMYDRAWRTSNLVTTNIVWVVADVAMPSFSAVAKRPEALRQNYLRMLKVLAIASFPLLMGMFVLADVFILTLYGPGWEESIWPLRLFLLYTLQRAVGSPVGVVYNAVGRPDVGFKLNLLVLPFFFGGILIAIPYGILGISIAVTVVKLVSGLAAIKLACNLIDLSFREALRSLWAPIEAALLMAGTVFVSRLILSQFFSLSAVGTLIIFTLIGGLVYLFLLIKRYPGQLEDIVFIIGTISPSAARWLRGLLHLEKTPQPALGQ